MTKTPLLYHDKPVFALDFGRSTVKIMQLDQQKSKKPIVTAYGYATFDPQAIVDGQVVDFEVVAKAVNELVRNQLVGELETRSVVIAVPNAETFSRIVTLPKMKPSDRESALTLEAVQSIPVSLDQLYVDHALISENEDGSQEIQIVAVKRTIVDSYLQLADLLGLEVAAIETNISAVTRLVTQAEPCDDVVTLIIDLGSVSSDLSIYDGHTVRATGSSQCGGENMTKLIAKRFDVSTGYAHTIKTRYGLEKSKRQGEITEAISSEINKLLAETKKIQRYYTERAGKKIDQIILVGGGANLPGLSSHLTNQLRIPARLCDPWINIGFGDLQTPNKAETTLYTTASGLALITPEELRK